VADGITHLIANLVMGGAIVGTVVIVAPEYLVPAFVGSVAGLIITPDMDVDHKTETEHIMWLIPPIGWLFESAFHSYALLFKHRGLSHNLFLGTLGRILWSLLDISIAAILLFGICELIGWHYDPTVGIKGAFMILSNPILVAAWWLQDIMHYILDL
jgi:uncharacterized metal-binding protein